MTGFSGRVKLKRDTKSCGEGRDTGWGAQKSRDETFLVLVREKRVKVSAEAGGTRCHYAVSIMYLA